MQQANFEKSSEGTNLSAPPPGASVDAQYAEIVAALDRGNHDVAGSLLKEALERSPEDNQLLKLSARQRRQADRYSRVYSLLDETESAVECDEFVRAVGAYREAANLSQGFEDLEKATFDLGVELAKELGERNWRIGRSLLEDADRLNPKLTIPEQRWQAVRAAEREEIITNVLEETALPKPADLGRARERLVRTVEQYPNDANLANRLRSIESTIEEKRRWDQRQRCLKKLTDLRDAMQRETEPADVGKYIAQGEAIAAPHSGETEFSKIVEDIRHQVISCEKAAAALKEDRIEDCLDECAWVLSRMRHHQVFLNLKKQAEEREVAMADEYSGSMTRIKELMAAGQLAEADALCTKAAARLPQFADLRDLKQEIAGRRLKEDKSFQENSANAQRLVERGERSLRDRQYRLAEQAFGGALKLAPEDKKLSGHVAGLLLGYARSIVRENAQAADEVVQLTERILPGTVIPADLTQAIRQKRERTQDEGTRWASLDRLGNLNAQLETAKKREEIEAVRATAAKQGFASSTHEDVKEAAAALKEKIESKNAALVARDGRRPRFYQMITLAATVLLGIGLAYWLNSNRPAAPRPAATTKPVERASVQPPAPSPAPAAVPNTGSLVIRSEVPDVHVAIGDKQYTLAKEPLKVELNADSYQVVGSHSGYKDFGPVTVAVNKAGETVLDLKLKPKPASLEIEGATPDMRIKLDGVSLAKAKGGRPLNQELSAGEHKIEIARSGFVTKTLIRNLGPGESAVLSGRDLQLDSSDASMAVASASVPPTTKAVTPMPDELHWQTVDKNNPDALRGFAAKYPNSPWAEEAKHRLDTVLVAREQGDWDNTDHGNSAALQDFLKRHPDGVHAAAASTALGEIDRKTHLAETQSLEDTAWKKVNRRDEASLQAYLHDFPGGRYQSQAQVDLATIRMAGPPANESAAILGVLSRLATAWSARDMASILAIQRNLSKREVKAELANVKELAMHISPASAPQIEGSQAIVLCRRQASQTFSDGTRKQIPESIVSYVLSKQNGAWTIEGTK